MTEPISVPTDDAALQAIQHALGGAYTVENGEHRLVGADYTLAQLLDFWSGRDPGTDTLIGYAGEMPIYEATAPVLHPHDVIAALVAEIQRMRHSRAIQNALNAIMRASQASHVAIGRAGDFQDAVAVLRAELGVTLPNADDEAHFAGYEPEDLEEARLHQPWEADLRRPHPIHANLGPSACPACGWDPLETP